MTLCEPVSPNHLVCRRCGRVLCRDAWQSCPAVRDCDRTRIDTHVAERGGLYRHVPAVGLGDRVERVLARMGVTAARYLRFKQMLGLAPTCGCASRKAWLNRVSAWWRETR